LVLLRIVPYNGHCVGNGSKQDTITHDSNQPDHLNIVKVDSNLPNNLAGSAVIENLVIDGNNQPNTTGILLKNVYNCLIRNLTIKNCDVGIKVQITDGNWSHANRFEHIRMINVKTGILFEGTTNAKDFSYTTIDDVRISLSGHMSDVGIKVGNPHANLYNAFIQATVWIANSNGRGMEVNGEIKYSLSNLTVEQSSGYTGHSVWISSGAIVSDNQSFLLTALGFGIGYKLTNNNIFHSNDIITHTS
jgi:hypothetical protein